MKHERWRNNVVTYLRKHDSATTDELITKVVGKTGKVYRRMPCRMSAINILSKDRRFIKIDKLQVGEGYGRYNITLWALKLNTLC